MTKNAPRADDQIINPRGNGIHLGCADEDAERVMFLRHPPRTRARLGKVHLAAPACHDDVLGVASDAGETQPLPERYGGRKVIVRRNTGTVNQISNLREESEFTQIDPLALADEPLIRQKDTQNVVPSHPSDLRIPSPSSRSGIP